MEDPNDLADAVARLEARVNRLESLYSLIDLLALPGLLAGGAARIFDSIQAADTIAAQAPGFYGKEMAGRGLAIRWTRFPEPGQLDIAVLGAIPFQLGLRVLHTPHIQSQDDIVVQTGDGEAIVFDTIDHLENGVLEFGAVITRSTTGVLRLCVGSRSHLEGSGGDTRLLGLPFVHLRSRPLLASPPS
jgi:hypothetical protein